MLNGLVKIRTRQSGVASDNILNRLACKNRPGIQVTNNGPKHSLGLQLGLTPIEGKKVVQLEGGTRPVHQRAIRVAIGQVDVPKRVVGSHMVEIETDSRQSVACRRVFRAADDDVRAGNDPLDRRPDDLG
jgi:hypothetical protein